MHHDAKPEGTKGTSTDARRGNANRSGSIRGAVRRIASVAVVVAGCLASTLTCPGSGIVTNNTTSALLPALQEGGLVQLAFPETLVAEIPLIIATDTILEGVVAGGRLATLSGGGARRVFHVLPGVRFEIRNCVVREGLSTNGGGIYNEGTLIASNVVFAACKANGTDGVAGAAGESRFGVGGNGGSGGAGAHGLGGALFNAGNASLVDCILNGNSAQGGKGGKGGDGGTGTWANGVGGSGGSGGVAHGGAIHGIPGSVLIVTNTLFTSNTATAGEGGAGGSASAGPGSGQGGPGASAAGGAIHSEGFLRVVRSAFATNAVVGGTSAAAGAPSGNVGRDGAGGGHAWGGALSSWSTGAVLNSTFVTNRVAGGNGGNGATGSFTSGDGGDGGDGLGGAVYGKGQLGLTNVTIAWNVVTNGLGGTGGSTLGGQAGSNGRAAGSGVAVGGGVVTLANAIVVEANGRGTIHGGATDAGHNLFSDGGTGRKVPGSIYSANPLFSEYKVWVNLTTPGFLLQPGSPAIDAGDPETSLSEDQRGLPRPSGLGPDIGSMEVATTNFVIGGVVWANEEEKRGVPGVVLEVADKSTTTDANGRFRFPPMPSGFYTVAIAGGGVGFTPRLIQLSLSADTTNLVFRTIATVVTYVPDAEQVGVGSIVGTGVAGRTYRLESSSDLRAWSFVARATSNAQGRVVFRHDTAGADRMFYRLAAE